MLNYMGCLPSLEMDTLTRVQILHKTACILHASNSLNKNVKPTILPPAMSKSQDKLGSWTLVWQSVKEKEKSVSKLFNLCVSFFLCGGVGKYVYKTCKYECTLNDIP